MRVCIYVCDCVYVSACMTMTLTVTVSSVSVYLCIYLCVSRHAGIVDLRIVEVHRLDAEHIGPEVARSAHESEYQ